MYMPIVQTQITDELIKVVGPIPSSDVFDIDDVKQLIDYERSRRIGPVLQAAADVGALHMMDRQVYIADSIRVPANSIIVKVQQS